jgi:hypothetical protein
LSFPLPPSQLDTVGGVTPTSAANWDAFILNCLRSLATAAAVGVNAFAFFFSVNVFLPRAFLAVFFLVAGSVHADIGKRSRANIATMGRGRYCYFWLPG